MATRNKPPKKSAAPDAGTQVAVPPPAVPLEVATGLEAIRLYGDRDAELYLSLEAGFFQEAFMTDRIVTAEESVRFIKKIETLIRTSPEYSRWVSHLRIDLGMNHCSFMSGLDMSGGEIGLEMHHCPLTLYTLVETVINHRLARGQAVTSMTVADEVMQMHFEDKVGVVPLASSIHKLVHNGTLHIHPSQVHGDWIGFLRDYSDGVSEELVAAVLRFVETTEEQVVASAQKVDATAALPRLRADTHVPSREEVSLLLMAPAG
jgi:hypothetical protein